MVNDHKIIGNLGADPEVMALASGGKVATFNVATSESWKDKTSGERKTRTEWHRVVAWRGLAEVIEKYLKKGSQVYISGPSRTRSYENEDGKKVYVTELEAHEMKMLGVKNSGQDTPPPPEPPKNEGDPKDDLPF